MFKLLITGNKKEIDTYSLVLLARGIEHELRRGDKWEIWVPEELYDKALQEITLYQLENQETSSSKDKSSPGGAEGVVFSMLLFAIFNVALLDFKPKDELFAIGTANNVLFLKGEWWRVFTALTLHSDFGHLLGNIVFSGLFFYLLRAYLSLGLCWLLAVLSGGIGNALNLVLSRGVHISIGFSTATFGILGVLSAFVFFERGRKRILITSGFALGLLGLLGAGKGNIDLGAHFLGLVVGFVIGCCLKLFYPADLRHKWETKGLLLAWGIVIFSWYVAFSR